MKIQHLFFYVFRRNVKIHLIVLLIGLTLAHGSTVLAEEDFFAAPNAFRFEERLEIPAFSLLSVDGKQERLEDYRGNVVLLNFWATWCGYCAIERPHLQAIHNKYKEKGFTVLGVSIDRAGPEVVKNFVEEHDITYPNLHDQTGEVASIFGIRGTPTTFILDVEGNAIGAVIGPADWENQEASELIEQLLAEKH